MEQYTTVYKDGRYQTLNEKGLPIDRLWHDHRCLHCATPLYKQERTFCDICKHFHKKVIQ